MKTIGIIGGMSWESSLEYYRIVNQAVKARLGGYHSADCLMYSVDFHDIEQMQMNDDWDAAGAALAAAAQRLERGGAEVIILATNTMHLVADAITSAVDVPFIHIADATANAIKAANVDRVALLGTRFTMEGDFMRGRLSETHGLDVRVPDNAGRTTVHRVIYDELVQGEINADSRAAYVEIIEGMAGDGAGGVILGCTEIGLLIQQEHVSIPAFDTTRIHAEAAVAFALAST
jgi:aspartate racemase